MRDEGKLPKWAQERINELRATVELAQEQKRQTELAYEVISGRDWFTLHGPRGREFPQDRETLFLLSRDGAYPFCTVYEGDVLLIGRKRHGD